MSEHPLLPDGVVKRVLHFGSGDLPSFPDGAKVSFHFRAFSICGNDENVLLDDSRSDNSPFELLLGKKFKLDIWEVLVKTMRMNEISEFICEPIHVASYPVVSKSLRDIKKKSPHKDSHDHSGGHQCGFAAFSQGLGYADLDEYLKAPKPIKFQFELLSVKLPGEFEKDVWSLSASEKLSSIPLWKNEGNAFYKSGDFDNASKKYSQALGCLEQLASREKPGSEEWLQIDSLKVSLLLNYSQCMLATHEYYKAIEHLTTVLEKDKNNVKALYRRAKAYHLVFNYTDARCDYQRAAELDVSLIKTVENELKKISIDEKQKEREDREKFKNAFN